MPSRLPSQLPVKLNSPPLPTRKGVLLKSISRIHLNIFSNQYCNQQLNLVCSPRFLAHFQEHTMGAEQFDVHGWKLSGWWLGRRTGWRTQGTGGHLARRRTAAGNWAQVAPVSLSTTRNALLLIPTKADYTQDAGLQKSPIGLLFKRVVSLPSQIYTNGLAASHPFWNTVLSWERHLE